MPIDTGASSTNPALKPAKYTAAHRRETATETATPLESHQRVGDAELKKRARGERGALWLLLGVIVMIGGTGWLMSDFRSTELVAESSDSQPFAAPPQATPLPAAAVISAGSQANQPEESSPAQQDDRRFSVSNSADPVKRATEKDSEVEDVLAQKVAKAEAAAQQRAAELSREAERIARLKIESDRMERERYAAENRLAKQHAARLGLERRARLEQKKMAAAREAAKKLAEERLQAEKRQAEAAATLSAQPNGATEVGVETKSVDGAADLLVTTAPDGDADSAIVLEEKEESVEFAANPCNGPTARFLSTCR